MDKLMINIKTKAKFFAKSSFFIFEFTWNSKYLHIFFVINISFLKIAYRISVLHNHYVSNRQSNVNLGNENGYVQGEYKCWIWAPSTTFTIVWARVFFQYIRGLLLMLYVPKTVPYWALYKMNPFLPRGN